MIPPELAPPLRSHVPRFARSSWLLPLLAGAASGVVLRLVFMGESGNAYDAMMASFILLAPSLVGVVTVCVAEITQRRSFTYYFFAGALANAAFVMGTLLIMVEGLICAIVIVPLEALIGGIAGLMAGGACRVTRRAWRAVYCVAALPLVLGGIEQRIPLPAEIDTVTTSRLIAATPEQVWPHVMNARDIEPREMDRAWMYRIGVPVPLSAVTEIRGNETVRHVSMGKGIEFDQVVEAWEPPRRVAWTNRFTEDSIPAGALDDHVRIGGRHFDLIDAEYTLDPVPGGTRMTARMRYRVSTHFNWYARPLGRALVANFEQTALAFYARRAEAQSAAAP